MSIVKNNEDANDVLQESFVKFWMNINSYDVQKGSFFTWMLNITRNTAIDKYRKNQNSQNNQKVFYSDLNTMMNFISTEKGIDTIGLKDVIKQLSSEQIEVINELYFKGATHQEAAGILNLPLGTVKSRVRSALKKLRKIYDVK